MFEGVIDEIEVKNYEANNYDRDPRLPRWGYNPGLEGCHIATPRTGLRLSEIPVGEFFVFKTFPTTTENFTLDIYKPKDVQGQILAYEAELEVKIALQAAGYQSLFFNETNAGIVRVVNKAVIPTLPEIRSIFALAGIPSPIGDTCKGEDELDGGTDRLHCAKCHLTWIKSIECTAYIEGVLSEGRRVRYIDDNGDIREKLIRPSAAHYAEAREIVTRGLETYLKFAKEQWGKICGEFKDGLRSRLHATEHQIRKNLHEYEPDRKDIAMVEKLAEGMNSNRQPQLPAGTDPNLLAFMAQSEERAAQMQQQTLQILGAIVERLPAAEVSPVTEKTTKEKTK